MAGEPTIVDEIPGIPGSIVVTNATSNAVPRGCALRLVWTRTLDPATAPPSGSEALIQVAGPQVPSVQTVATLGNEIALMTRVGLRNGGREWTAELISVGGEGGLLAGPIPVSYCFPAC